jgi:hypothetical protein
VAHTAGGDQLLGHDLVDREMQVGIDLLPRDHHGLGAFADRRVELRMSGADEQRAIVLVPEVEELGLAPLWSVVDRRDGEGQAVAVIGVRARRIAHARSVARRC